MPAIKEKDITYFENALYLPMLVKIIEKDINLINKLPFKLNRPYLKILENAYKIIRRDLKSSEMFLLRNDMKVYKWESSSDSTTYVYMSGGIEDHRKFLNVDIKAKCDELLHKYFTYE